MDRTMRLGFGGHGLNLLLRSIAALAVAGAAAFFVGCSSNVNIAGGCYYSTRAMQHSQPAGESFTLNVDTKEGNRLDIYFRIPYSRLHFEKDLDVLKSTYTVSFVLRDADGTIAHANDFDRTVIAKTYAESVSPLYDAFLKMFYLPPGDYTLDIAVEETWSHQVSRRREKVKVAVFPKDDFCASDYLLFEKATPGQGGISLKPVFPSGLSYVKDSMGMFQEIYNVHHGDTIRLSTLYSFVTTRDTPDTKHISLVPPYGVRFSECVGPPDSVYYRSDSLVVSPSDGVLQIFQSFPRMMRGATTLVRKVFLSRNGVVDSSVSAKRFSVFTPAFPRLNGEEEELAALSYIAWPPEIDSIRAGKTPDERSRRLLLFWEDHGGSARRREFYNRIAEANEIFSSCMEGWKTPMGISYIICGPPDFVDCQGGTNELWYYDLGNNRSFIIPLRRNYGNVNEPYYEIPPFSVSDFIWGDFVNRWRR